MKRFVLLCLIVVALLALSSCAPRANASPGAEPAGFLLGLWHGLTVLFTFVISLFNRSVTIYEVNNSGGWYNFGYLLGIMSFWGGGGGSAASRRR